MRVAIAGSCLTAFDIAVHSPHRLAYLEDIEGWLAILTVSIRL